MKTMGLETEEASIIPMFLEWLLTLMPTQLNNQNMKHNINQIKTNLFLWLL